MVCLTICFELYATDKVMYISNKKERNRNPVHDGINIHLKNRFVKQNHNKNSSFF